MNLRVQELLKKRDIQSSLEVLKLTNENAKLVYADYINEKDLFKLQFIDEETWEAYLNELFIRVKQLDEEQDNAALFAAGSENAPANSNELRPRVFISYNNLDQQIVNKMARHMEGKVDYFIDYVSMDPGDIIKERISKEILERDYFLVLISKNSISSPWVCLEGVIGDMKTQWKKGKLIPIKIDDSLTDNKFIENVVEQMRKKVQEVDADIENSKKYLSGRKYLDTEREMYIHYLKHYDTMINTYREKANVNISGDLFEDGMKNLMRTIIHA